MGSPDDYKKHFLPSDQWEKMTPAQRKAHWKHVREQRTAAKATRKVPDKPDLAPGPKDVPSVNVIPISEDQPSSSAPGSLLRALLSNKSVQQVDSSKVDSDADQLILDFGGKKYKLSCSASTRSYTSFAS